MERTRQSSNGPSRVERQLASLKILSRLLALELHTQNAPRITISREQALEIKTLIDMYIEGVLKSQKGGGGGTVPAGSMEVQAVAPRVN